MRISAMRKQEGTQWLYYPRQCNKTSSLISKSEFKEITVQEPVYKQLEELQNQANNGKDSLTALYE